MFKSLQEIIYNIDPFDTSDTKAGRSLKKRAKREQANNRISYNVNQKAAVRSGDWKMITGIIGFDGIVPNPKNSIAKCKYFNFAFY